MLGSLKQHGTLVQIQGSDYARLTSLYANITMTYVLFTLLYIATLLNYVVVNTC